MVRQAVATLFQGSSPAAREAAAAQWQASRWRQRLKSYIVTRHHAGPVIAGIKIVHTIIFAVLMGCVVSVSVAGARDRMSRRTTLALVAILGEGVVISRNQGRCPLTDLVEDLGSEHGSVSDIFLPTWVAQHIPHISSTFLGVGMTVFGLRRIAGGLQLPRTSVRNGLGPIGTTRRTGKWSHS
jgi:hypothetical protein